MKEYRFIFIDKISPSTKILQIKPVDKSSRSTILRPTAINIKSGSVPAQYYLSEYTEPNEDEIAV